MIKEMIKEEYNNDEIYLERARYLLSIDELLEQTLENDIIPLSTEVENGKILFENDILIENNPNPTVEISIAENDANIPLFDII